MGGGGANVDKCSTHRCQEPASHSTRFPLVLGQRCDMAIFTLVVNIKKLKFLDCTQPRQVCSDEVRGWTQVWL